MAKLKIFVLFRKNILFFTILGDLQPNFQYTNGHEEIFLHIFSTFMRWNGLN